MTGGAFDPRVLARPRAARLPRAPSRRGRGPRRPGQPGRGAGGRLRRRPLAPARSAGAARPRSPRPSTSAGSARAWRSAGRSPSSAPPCPSSARPGAGALLEAGGDIVARGRGSPGGPVDDRRSRTPVDGEDRRRRGRRTAPSAPRRSASTRGRADDGRAVHHLLDPRTGEPGGGGLVSVTVAGPDPPGPRSGRRRSSWRARAGSGRGPAALGLAAWWIRDDGDHGDDAGRPRPDGLAAPPRPDPAATRCGTRRRRR